MSDIDRRNQNKGVVTCMGSRKSKLERNLIIALIILLVLFIALLLFVIIKPSVIKKKCATPACLTAASQIMNRINTKVDPCTDFFKFSCENFQIGAKTPIDTIREKVEKQAMDIVNESVDENDHYLLKIQKKLYQTCLNQTLAEQNVLEEMNRTVTDIGWPVVIGYQWRQESFDWQQLISKLRRKGYPFQMMLNIDTTLENSTYIVQVEPPKLDLIKESTKQYKTYMTNVAVLFGAEVKRAEIEMEKVFDFTHNLYKIIDQNANVNVLTVREFQEENADIDWLQFLNSVLYPASQLSLEEEVLFPSQEFTTEFFNLIYRTPKRVVANYIVWNVIEKLIEYMPEQIKSLRKNYECHVHEARERKRSDFCTRIFTNFFPVPSDVMFVRKYLPKTKLEKVKEIVKNVKSELKTMLSKTSWLDESSRLMSLEKLENILDFIGTPYDYFDDFYIDQFVWPGQQKKIIKHENFFLMLLDTMRMHQNNIFFRLHKKEQKRTIDEMYTLMTQVNAHYCVECNSMLIPVGILQDFFYDENRPMYLNYGAIGVIIGHELSHGFAEVPHHSGYTEDIWTNATIDAYEKEVKCIIDDVENFHKNSTKILQSNDITLIENLADYTGIRVAYSAYKSWVQKNGEENMLVGVPYTPNQLFWISTITHQCFMPTQERDYHADNTFRTIAPLRNTEDFAKDFNCPINSPMNPSKKCKVF